MLKGLLMPSVAPGKRAVYRYGTLVFAGVYCLTLLNLLPHLSLWLDEIHDLGGVRFLSFAQLTAYTDNDGGGVPLGSLTQFAFVRILGFSATTGRLSSAISSLIACLAIGLICRKLRFRFAFVALTIFALLPLQLRYATEARPYAEAVCFSVLCTLVFVQLQEKVTVLRCTFYLLTAVAGLYTQPFSFFIPFGHWFWLALSPSLPARRTLLVLFSGMMIVVALAFLPWYIYAHQFWRASINAGHFQFVFGWKEVSLIFHELGGGGYFGTTVLLFLSGYGFLRSSQIDSSKKLFWMIQLVVPLVGPVVADAFFGYFVAIRQFIFVVPALAIGSALGIKAISLRKPVLGASALLVLTAILVLSDVRWFTKPREDWRAPANTLEAQISKEGGCVIFTPAIAEEYFSFFNPHLRSLQCFSSLLPDQVWLAISPYDSKAKYQENVKRLTHLGFVQPSLGRLDLDGPRIELFQRRTGL